MYYAHLSEAGVESQVGYRVRLWARFIAESCSQLPDQAVLARYKHMMPAIPLHQQLDVSPFVFNIFSKKVFLTFSLFIDILYSSGHRVSDSCPISEDRHPGL